MGRRRVHDPPSGRALTVEGDVRDFHPLDFDRVPGFIASPPCQTFSAAGKGAGRAALDTVYQLAKTLQARRSVDSDERTGLVLEPLRWVLAAIDHDRSYEWLAFEQVPTVLPVWDFMAKIFRREGYYVATGKLLRGAMPRAQTRKRAVLIARLDREVSHRSRFLSITSADCWTNAPRLERTNDDTVGGRRVRSPAPDASRGRGGGFTLASRRLAFPPDRTVRSWW